MLRGRRIITLLLALALALSLLPTAAFAITGREPILGNTVSTVAITGLNDLVAGGKVYSTPTTSYTGYAVDTSYSTAPFTHGIAWVDQKNPSTPLATTAKVVSGHTYMVGIRLKAASGYSFKLVSFRICEAQRQKEAAWRTLLLKHHASKASLCSIR